MQCRRRIEDEVSAWKLESVFTQSVLNNKFTAVIAGGIGEEEREDDVSALMIEDSVVGTP